VCYLGLLLGVSNVVGVVCGCVWLYDCGRGGYSKKDLCTVCMVAEARRFPSSYRDCFKGHNQL